MKNEKGVKMTDRTCEERIDGELERELQRIRDAIRLDEIMEYPEDNVTAEEILEARRGYVLPAGEAREAYDIVVGGYDGETLRGYIESALCFDYVPRGTFDDQEEGYFRFQMSWGGPGDEFRFFVGIDKVVHRIEYWFLDWYDGACRVLRGDDFKMVEWIYDWFHEIGAVEAELDKKVY
jgi:hypothetical protein